MVEQAICGHKHNVLLYIKVRHYSTSTNRIVDLYEIATA